jgi:siroheme synthase-like protein
MRTHPVFLCLEGRPCVVIGSDAPAAAKVEACLSAGAEVTLIAPESVLEPMPGPFRHVARAYRAGDLVGAVLAYASTHDPELIARLRDEARRERVLLNVVDEPEACSFFAPAVVRRGDLGVAIGTGGESPGLSARLRRAFEERLGPEFAPYVAILGAVRRALGDRPERAAVLATLHDSALLDHVRAGRRAEIDRLLAETAGPGLSLARLGLALDGVG